MRLWYVLVLCCLGQSALSDTQVEFGPTYLSYDYTDGQVLLVTENFRKYSVGFGILTEQTAKFVTCGPHKSRSCRKDFDIPQMFILQVERIFRAGKFEFSLGPAYFSSISRVSGTPFMASISAGYRITDRLTIRLRHWSNAGTASPNLGEDTITIGYRF